MFCMKCGAMLEDAAECPVCGAENEGGSRNNYLRAPEIMALMEDDEDLALIAPAAEEAEEESAEDAPEDAAEESAEDAPKPDNADNTENETAENDAEPVTEEPAESSDKLEETADGATENAEKNEPANVPDEKPAFPTFEIFPTEEEEPEEPPKPRKKRKFLVHRALMLLSFIGLIAVLILLIVKSRPEGEPVTSESSSRAEVVEATEAPTEPEPVTEAPTEPGKTAEDRLAERDALASELNGDAVRLAAYSDVLIAECTEGTAKLTFSGDFDPMGYDEVYDEEAAERFISGASDKWDDSSACGSLKGGGEKKIYYFFHSQTWGRQYVLADSGKAPDGTDVLYLHPVDNSGYYIAVRSENGRKSAYIVDENSLFAVPDKYLDAVDESE